MRAKIAVNFRGNSYTCRNLNLLSPYFR